MQSQKTIENIAKNLKILRLRNQHSQEYISYKMNVSRSLAGAWEDGRSLPNLECFEMLSHFYKVSIDWLVRKDLMKKSIRDQVDNYSRIQSKF